MGGGARTQTRLVYSGSWTEFRVKTIVDRAPLGSLGVIWVSICGHFSRPCSQPRRARCLSASCVPTGNFPAICPCCADSPGLGPCAWTRAHEAYGAGDTEDGLGNCGLDPDQPSEAQAIETQEKVAPLLGRRAPFVVLDRTELGLAGGEGSRCEFQWVLRMFKIAIASAPLQEVRGAIDSNT